jgi:DNA-binding transcriptional regulator/RsmH inhibitor MraZ
MGEAGDLVVEAIAAERTEGAVLARVTVEVKCAWNQELDEAMRSQLAERYLLRAGHRQGIYVVGWFAAENWDTDDWRRARCSRRALQESRDFFGEQAQQVSAQCGVEIDAIVLDCSLHSPGSTQSLS